MSGGGGQGGSPYEWGGVQGGHMMGKRGGEAEEHCMSGGEAYDLL